MPILTFLRPTRNTLGIAALLALAACGGPKPIAPTGSAAYEVIPAPTRVPTEYRIGPLDVLSMSVFREPDFDNENIDVDADGLVNIPLIGQVEAGGKTARELADLIARRLDERYLVDPQVTITVATAHSQRVTVDGEVNKAGVFPIRGRSTLLQSVALAEGTTPLAKLDQVLVFRNIDGNRAVARFDLAAIRAGLDPDPEVLGGDTVVVGYSAARSLVRDILQILPAAAGVFVAIENSN